MSVLTRIEEWLIGSREPPAQEAYDKFQDSLHGSRNANFAAQCKNETTKSASEHALSVAEEAIRQMEQIRHDDKGRRHAKD